MIENIEKINMVKSRLSTEIYRFNLLLAARLEKMTRGSHIFKGIRLLDDCYIAGGAIASLLNDEEPNDFDLYFKDRAGVGLLQKFLEDEHNIDLVKEVSKKYYNIHLNGKLITSNAITLKNKFQVITRVYGKPEDVIKSFDYQHTRSYYDVKKGVLYISEHTYDCIVNKRLEVVNRANFQAWREEKFKMRGWKY